ncbi:MAG: hypothetical protein IPJ41_01900 [Phycisphaerales bacterium]|nr:hypothetical protein [Phycisphaerales bacterium]
MSGGGDLGQVLPHGAARRLARPWAVLCIVTTMLALVVYLAEVSHWFHKDAAPPPEITLAYDSGGGLWNEVTRQTANIAAGRKMKVDARLAEGQKDRAVFLVRLCGDGGVHATESPLGSGQRHFSYDVDCPGTETVFVIAAPAGRFDSAGLERLIGAQSESGALASGGSRAPVALPLMRQLAWQGASWAFLYPEGKGQVSSAPTDEQRVIDWAESLAERLEHLQLREWEGSIVGRTYTVAE